MVSKTRKRRQARKAKLEANNGVLPAVPLTPAKSVLDKKTRPNMKRKQKWRLGLMSNDIYEGHDEKMGVQWVCPACGQISRVIGYCVDCATGVARPKRTVQQDTAELEQISRSIKGLVSSAGSGDGKDRRAKAKRTTAKNSGQKLRFKKKI